MRMIQSGWFHLGLLAGVVLVLAGAFASIFGHPFAEERMAYVCDGQDQDLAVQLLRVACPEEKNSGTLVNGE